MILPVDESTIYNAATSCSDLFDQYLEIFGPTVSNHDIAEDLQDQFNLWAAYVGAFASTTASLDARLMGQKDVKNMILELLIMIKNNLKHELDTKRDATIRLTESNHETPESLPLLLGLYAVEEAVKRLHSLSMAIRRIAARGWQQRSPFNSLNQDDGRCYRDFVRFKFPNAKQSLIDQLGQSIYVRGRSMFGQQQHGGKVTKKRRRNSSPAQMMEIFAQPSENAGLTMLTTSLPTPGNQPIVMSETNYSNIDKQEFANRVNMSKPSYSHISRNSSIRERENERFSYPKMPNPKKGQLNALCPICFERLEFATLTRSVWNAHIDLDLEPFVCISEECKEPPKFFVNLQDWKEHMQKKHTLDWARNIHAITWRCEMDHPGEDAGNNFDSKGDFIQHLSAAHAKKLTKPQIMAKTRRNRTTMVRGPFTCPLCNCCPEEVVSRLEEEPYELLSGHIARHLKALAFYSLSFIDYGDNASSSSEMRQMSGAKGCAGGSNVAHLESDDEPFDDIQPATTEETRILDDDQVFPKPPELDNPVIWPKKLSRVYSGRDETLERFAAIWTASKMSMGSNLNIRSPSKWHRKNSVTPSGTLLTSLDQWELEEKMRIKREVGALSDEEPAQEQKDKRAELRVKLMTKDIEVVMLDVLLETTVETITVRFRNQRDIGSNRDVGIWFEGERLAVHQTMEEVGINDMDLLEVYIK